MSLLDTVRAGIATAASLTRPLQGTVQHYAWVNQDAYGAITYDPPVTGAGTERKALVDLSRKLRKTEAGELVMTVATVTFLDVIAPNGASGRTEPIDVRDKIVLPDGTTGPIARGGGFMDAITGRPLLNEILIMEL
jgi:hypothetical protein